MRLIATACAVIVLSAAPIAAEPLAATSASITVKGTGSVSTQPDIATISYVARGEGATSDAALRALVEKRDAIQAGIASFGAEASGGELRINEVRGPKCGGDDDDGDDHLSTGPCAVIGYIATLPLRVRTSAVEKAATMTGLIGRLGGVDPRVESYGISRPGEARRRAMAVALADARTRAEAIAAGTRVKLGVLLNASDGDRFDNGSDIVVTGVRVASPGMAIPPITVATQPQLIETPATVVVTYRVVS